MTPDHARQILGVDRDADSSQIRSVFAARVKSLHPDTTPQGDNITTLVADFQQLREAKQILLVEAEKKLDKPTYRVVGGWATGQKLNRRT